jgi:hypothetical protein
MLMPESELLRELHANLWASLRHVFNTDRVLLAVLYATNFAGFVVLAAESLHQPVTTGVTVVAIVLLNGLILLSLNNSKEEVLSLIRILIEMYKDNGLGKYFDDSKLEYYRRRYALWTFLVPSLAGAAILLGLVISRGL